MVVGARPPSCSLHSFPVNHHKVTSVPLSTTHHRGGHQSSSYGRFQSPHLLLN